MDQSPVGRTAAAEESKRRVPLRVMSIYHLLYMMGFCVDGAT